MAERCGRCGLPKTDLRFVGPRPGECGATENALPDDVRECQERETNLLRSRIAKLEAVVEAQAKVIEETEKHRGGQYWGYRHDAAKAELERVKG